MANAHVCDECKTVAPIGEAHGWWRLEAIDDLLGFGEKDEYHFCSWSCIAEFTRQHVERRMEKTEGR
jgi:hypothetical protein